MSDKSRSKSKSTPLSDLKDLYHTWRRKPEPSCNPTFSNGSQQKRTNSDSFQVAGQNYDYQDTAKDQADIHTGYSNLAASSQSTARTYQPKKDDMEKLRKLTSHEEKSRDLKNRHRTCQFYSEKRWLELQNHKTNGQIMKPDELKNLMSEPPVSTDERILDRIQGSMIGMALGDALGAHVEFRPRQYLLANPVTDLVGGGTWGLRKGQFTDDTSMALCLANSLLARKGFCPYDQLVRYKWWYKLGYMSSTGECFDIGNATRDSIEEFRSRQARLIKDENIPKIDIDYLDDPQILEDFKVNCSQPDVAGNGALMRLAPVPLFFFRYPSIAVEYSGISGEITHGDIKAYDACRYYAALIVGAFQGYSKDELLDKKFYSKKKAWFGEKPLCPEIRRIAEGSFKQKRGYDDGIRGKGYIVAALEAALWAFWSDGDSFEKGALAAVNLGDDTDTTAAIYGQLAGAYYGYRRLPKKWLDHVYAHEFMLNLSKWIGFEGENWKPKNDRSLSPDASSYQAATHTPFNSTQYQGDTNATGRAQETYKPRESQRGYDIPRSSGYTSGQSLGLQPLQPYPSANYAGHNSGSAYAGQDWQQYEDVNNQYLAANGGRPLSGYRGHPRF